MTPLRTHSVRVGRTLGPTIITAWLFTHTHTPAPGRLQPHRVVTVPCSGRTIPSGNVRWLGTTSLLDQSHGVPLDRIHRSRGLGVRSVTLNRSYYHVSQFGRGRGRHHHCFPFLCLPATSSAQCQYARPTHARSQWPTHPERKWCWRHRVSHTHRHTKTTCSSHVASAPLYDVARRDANRIVTDCPPTRPEFI